MPAEFALNKSYSFDSYTRPGRRAVGWKLNSIVGYEIANQLGYDVAATHARVLSSIPGTTVPRDPTKLTYLLFATNDGRKECIAKEWINAATVEEFSNAVINVLVRGSLLSVDDVTRIQDIFAQNGYQDVTVSLASGAA